VGGVESCDVVTAGDGIVTLPPPLLLLLDVVDNIGTDIVGIALEPPSS